MALDGAMLHLLRKEIADGILGAKGTRPYPSSLC